MTMTRDLRRQAMWCAGGAVAIPLAIYALVCWVPWAAIGAGIAWLSRPVVAWLGSGRVTGTEVWACWCCGFAMLFSACVAIGRHLEAIKNASNQGMVGLTRAREVWERRQGVVGFLLFSSVFLGLLMGAPFAQDVAHRDDMADRLNRVAHRLRLEQAKNPQATPALVADQAKAHKEIDQEDIAGGADAWVWRPELMGRQSCEELVRHPRGWAVESVNGHALGAQPSVCDLFNNALVLRWPVTQDAGSF